MNGTALSHGLEVICGLGKYASRFLRAVNTPATVHHHGTFGVVARRRQRANRADGAYYARRCHVRRAGCAVYGLAVRVLRRRQGHYAGRVYRGNGRRHRVRPGRLRQDRHRRCPGPGHDLITVPLKGDTSLAAHPARAGSGTRNRGARAVQAGHHRTARRPQTRLARPAVAWPGFPVND